MISIQRQAPLPQQRCAIYTRKSVEQGLEIEFNTLESQRSICSAYIMVHVTCVRRFILRGSPLRRRRSLVALLAQSQVLMWRATG